MRNAKDDEMFGLGITDIGGVVLLSLSVARGASSDVRPQVLFSSSGVLGSRRPAVQERETAG